MYRWSKRLNVSLSAISEKEYPLIEVDVMELNRNLEKIMEREWQKP